ncbi:hypothetical protein ACE6H2_001593 [Prunus campanulata]
MTFKTIFVSIVCLLVAAVAVTKAEPNIDEDPRSLVAAFYIQGTVFCTTDGNSGDAADPFLTPTFPNATVELQCGPANTTIALVRTIKNGVFSILLDPLTSSAGPLISSCRLVLTTPLSSCNATLSTQPFSSALQVIRPTQPHKVYLFNVFPVRFMPNV